MPACGHLYNMRLTALSEYVFLLKLMFHNICSLIFYIPKSRFQFEMNIPLGLRIVYPAGVKPVIRRTPLASLFYEYKQMTDGSHFWRDNYLLERWAESKQPVVSYGQDLNGYKLLKRLGDWCWLARNKNNKSVPPCYLPSNG